MDTNTWRFLAGCTSHTRPVAAFFAVEARDAADAGSANTSFCVYHLDNWYSYVESPEWSAVAIAAVTYPGETQLVVALSGDSSIWELRPKERLERLARIGDYTGMTNLVDIGHAIYACGMGRLVLRREATGTWANLSAPWPGPSEGVIGFTALAGGDSTLIYAVGWQGEIWVRSASEWTKEDTPTSANLNALTLSPDGEVYVVGDEGALLRGRRGLWSVIDTHTDLNLTDIYWHAGEIFVSSDFDVYRLTPNGLVSDLVEQSGGADVSALKLFGRDALLFSVGPSDVFRRVDGAWHRLA